MAISRIETNSIAPSQTLTTPIIATTMGVGGATPAGSGSGITFPAAQSASTDANTLDDYEEGTWDPILISPGYSFTYNWQDGWYVKIGSLVWAGGTVSYSGKSGSGSSGVQLGNLPFASRGGQNNEMAALSVGYASGWVTAPSNGYLSQNTTAISITTLSGAAIAGITASALGGSSYMDFSIVYQAA